MDLMLGGVWLINQDSAMHCDILANAMHYVMVQLLSSNAVDYLMLMSPSKKYVCLSFFRGLLCIEN